MADLPKLSEFEKKRLQNLRENSQMLEQLLNELHDKSSPNFFGDIQPKKKNYTPKRRDSMKRIQERFARSPPRTRSRRSSLSSGSSSGSTSPNEDRLNVTFNFEKRRRTDDFEELQPRKKRRHTEGSYRRSEGAYVFKTPEEITQRDLNAVANNTSHKVYDSGPKGTTCHQCRQKTSDQKTICRYEKCWGVRGQFCGPCLRNRYGEDARAALKDPKWHCPPCRGICNCSFCRAREGKACTGILIHLARDHGFADVNSFLQSFRNQKSKASKGKSTDEVSVKTEENEANTKPVKQEEDAGENKNEDKKEEIKIEVTTSENPEPVPNQKK